MKNCLFTNGRESSIEACLVPSNYHDPIKGEVQLQIDGPVSLETLETIVSWFRNSTKKVTLEGGGATSVSAL
jgi:hypothetical protein